MRHASLKTLKGFVREEKSTAKLYRSLGFPSQARQEAAHARFFSKRIKGLK